MMYYVLAYLIGGIPFGLLIGKWIKGVDIREHGSRNLGATNAVRVLGKGLGLVAFICDFLKGAGPVWIAQSQGFGLNEMVYVGLLSILGHVFPVYLKFKGGKGVATSAGALLAITPAILGATFCVWFITFKASRMVSLASMVAPAVAVVLAFTWQDEPLGKHLSVTLLLSFLLVLIVIRHRSNIGRIIRGEESKFIAEKKAAQASEADTEKNHE